jgi:site-specific recombinase XerD
MASLTKKATSPFYFACFRNFLGTQCRRSTHSTDPKEAQRIADIFEAIARKQINARRLKASMAELFRSMAGDDSLPTATVTDYCASWLRQKERECAPGTMELYRKSIEKFIKFLGARANGDLADIRKQDVVSWRNSLDLSASTANLNLKCVKMVFKSARRDDLIEVDPCEFVPMIKKDSGDGVRRPFSLEEIRRLLEVADEEWKSLILFGLYSGQRMGDIVALTWNAIDLVRDELHLITRKTGKRLTVPMASALKEHILTLSAPDTPDSPVHPRSYATLMRDGRVRCLSSQFGNLLAAAGLRVGLPHVSRGIGRDGRRQSQALSYHCLRHTTVSLMRASGAPEASVMAVVGHSSVAVNRSYCHVGTDALLRAVDTLPRLPK